MAFFRRKRRNGRFRRRAPRRRFRSRRRRMFRGRRRFGIMRMLRRVGIARPEVKTKYFAGSAIIHQLAAAFVAYQPFEGGIAVGDGPDERVGRRIRPLSMTVAVGWKNTVLELVDRVPSSMIRGMIVRSRDDLYPATNYPWTVTANMPLPLEFLEREPLPSPAFINNKKHVPVKQWNRRWPSKPLFSNVAGDLNMGTGTIGTTGEYDGNNFRWMRWFTKRWPLILFNENGVTRKNGMTIIIASDSPSEQLGLTVHIHIKLRYIDN